MPAIEQVNGRFQLNGEPLRHGEPLTLRSMLGAVPCVFFDLGSPCVAVVVQPSVIYVVQALWQGGEILAFYIECDGGPISAGPHLASRGSWPGGGLFLRAVGPDDPIPRPFSTWSSEERAMRACALLERLYNPPIHLPMLLSVADLPKLDVKRALPRS